MLFFCLRIVIHLSHPLFSYLSFPLSYFCVLYSFFLFTLFYPLLPSSPSSTSRALSSLLFISSHLFPSLFFSSPLLLFTSFFFSFLHFSFHSNPFLASRLEKAKKHYDSALQALRERGDGSLHPRHAELLAGTHAISPSSISFFPF